MTNKGRSKPTLPRSKKTVEPTGAMTILMLPGAALKGIELPTGAVVAIVSDKPGTVRKIRHRFKGKKIVICRIHEIHAEASAPSSKAREAVINHAASSRTRDHLQSSRASALPKRICEKPVAPTILIKSELDARRIASGRRQTRTGRQPIGCAWPEQSAQLPNPTVSTRTGRW